MTVIPMYDVVSFVRIFTKICRQVGHMTSYLSFIIFVFHFLFFRTMAFLDRWHYYFSVLYFRARGCKTFFMLNSVEHEFFPAHKC